MQIQIVPCSKHGPSIFLKSKHLILFREIIAVIAKIET